MTSAMPVQCWCNAGAMLVQCSTKSLSYEATQFEADTFVGLFCSRERNDE